MHPGFGSEGDPPSPRGSGTLSRLRRATPLGADARGRPRALSPADPIRHTGCGPTAIKGSQMPPPRRVTRAAPRTGFRDRFFTRRTAEAIMAPSSIVAAGAGTAAGVLAGLPLLAVGALGAAAYAGWVLTRMPRNPRAADAAIDPRRLHDPWRTHVREALQAEQRFGDAVAATTQGPLHDRLADMAERVAEAVRESWRIANRGQQLEVALGQLDSVDRLEQQLDGARNREGVAASLRAQIDTYRRIEATAVDARERLRLLDARLDETVARAIEVGLRAGDPVEVGRLDDDVESLVTEMEALRRGLDETAGHAVPGV
ncbi:hypothetical protein BH23ACT10_BH23ACT10_20320 [soil metagenome]